MSLSWHDDDSEARFESYVEALAQVLGHADRVGPFRSYCTGLLLPGERKSVEPMAARLAPQRTGAEHQSLLHFVGQSPWDDRRLLEAVREQVLPALTSSGPIETWIIDDTGFVKKGRHSVGVARQWCGQLGKQDNCQVAVSLSVATASASLPVAWRLYLPEAWAADRQRRARAHVPEEVVFQTKPQIALAQIEAALADGVAPGVVLADSGYGHSSELRDGIAALGLEYVVAVLANAVVWPPGVTPAVPQWSGRGKRAKRLRRDGDDVPVVQIAALAKTLSAKAWQTVTWREGAAVDLSSRFAAVRVVPVQGDARRSVPRPEQWLLIEWPQGEAEPVKFWLSNLPADTSIQRLVYLAKQRWLIERDYLDLKQELGLDHYEGRGWRGFHHHAALCIAAYGFLLAERAAIPPSAARTARLVEAPALPAGYRPRGATAAHGTPCRSLDRNTAPPNRPSPGNDAAAMSMLRANQPKPPTTRRLMTQ